METDFAIAQTNDSLWLSDSTEFDSTPFAKYEARSDEELKSLLWDKEGLDLSDFKVLMAEQNSAAHRELLAKSLVSQEVLDRILINTDNHVVLMSSSDYTTMLSVSCLTTGTQEG
jgi:hypothetical protein